MSRACTAAVLAHTATATPFRLGNNRCGGHGAFQRGAVIGAGPEAQRDNQIIGVGRRHRLACCQGAHLRGRQRQPSRQRSACSSGAEPAQFTTPSVVSANCLPLLPWWGLKLHSRLPNLRAAAPAPRNSAPARPAAGWSTALPLKSGTAAQVGAGQAGWAQHDQLCSELFLFLL